MPAPIVVAAAAAAPAVVGGVGKFVKKHPWLLLFGVGSIVIAILAVWVFFAGAVAGLSTIRPPINSSSCVPFQVKQNLPEGIFGNTTPVCTGGVNGEWVSPVEYANITSFVGWRIHPVRGTLAYHNGLDLSGGAGTPIYAAGGGVVIETQTGSPSTGFGNYVMIDHGEGLVSIYAHLMPGGVHVSVGDTVNAGDHIGSMGTTGVSTGEHLHFQMELNGVVIDSLVFMLNQGIDLNIYGVNWNLVDNTTGYNYCNQYGSQLSWC